MAVKCDNCDNDALYTTGDPGVNPAHYCNICLPYWLENRAKAGHFPLVEPTSSKKAKEEVVVVEEPKVEEGSEEEENV